MADPRADPVAGTEHEVRIVMRDGVELAATLFLPDEALGPQPCLLEALPYRKDDLTASYAETYRRLRDDHAYAVCRLDLRGTGSSGGDATDEYPASEQADLVEVIGWRADQPWCTGAVGMWGTSYSGFNALQVACERPPALKAVCAIYASDDRWTDDVHWRGGALRLVDLVDYCHYMTPMNALPPVPAVWPEDAAGGWRAEWLRRIDDLEPWVLTWLREDRDGAYWRHGSVRQGPTPAAGDGYDRISCPVLVVSGWADGYRNTSFRTVEALAAHGVPHRLLAGPWAHADPATAIPGPRIDLDREMVAWWDRWLRGEGVHQDVADVFVRSSTRPAPDLDTHEGSWIRTPWPSPATRWEALPLAGPRTLAVDPDVGTTAWIDCAGHLPWGLSDDQRADDARSLTWDLPAQGRTVVGRPRVRLRLSASAPAASVSVKLCDVFADGTSALVTRGTLDLTHRHGLHAPAASTPLTPGEAVEVTLELDACAYAYAPGQVLRVSVAGSDWPNTVAPPGPVSLTVHDATVELPLMDPLPPDRPDLAPGSPHSSEDPDGVVWSIDRDVLRRTTTCRVGSRSEYAVPHDGTATEEYAGTVGVDRRTHDQWAEAVASFGLSWPGVDVHVNASMRVDVSATHLDVRITLVAEEGPPANRTVVREREWHERIPR